MLIESVPQQGVTVDVFEHLRQAGVAAGGQGVAGRVVGAALAAGEPGRGPHSSGRRIGGRRAGRAEDAAFAAAVVGHYGYRASTVVVRCPVAMSYTWPETLTLGESRGEVSSRSTSALTVMSGSATAEASSAASGRPVASAA
jgi:hypothetical protein